jgi:hypothetical protein
MEESTVTLEQKLEETRVFLFDVTTALAAVTKAAHSIPASLDDNGKALTSKPLLIAGGHLALLLGTVGAVYAAAKGDLEGAKYLTEEANISAKNLDEIRSSL